LQLAVPGEARVPLMLTAALSR